MSVALSAVNPMGKFKVLKTAAVEVAKAVITYTPKKGLTVDGNIKEVVVKAAVNTAAAVGAGKLIDAGSAKAVKEADKNVRSAVSGVKKAESRSLRSPGSIKKAEAVTNARSSARSARDRQVVTRMLNATVGQDPNATQAAAQALTNRVNKIYEKKEEKEDQ